MPFVYLHILWFGCWIGFAVEDYPFGLLTMMVSLEAIFLSTFVLISQNRADVRRQVVADQQWETVQKEDSQNEQLLDLAAQTLRLVQDVHPAWGGGPARDEGSSGVFDRLRGSLTRKRGGSHRRGDSDPARSPGRGPTTCASAPAACPSARSAVKNAGNVTPWGRSTSMVRKAPGRVRAAG